MKCELKFAGIILLVIGSFGCKETKEAKEGSSEERKQLELIYQELSAQYDTLRLQVVREPAGYLKYPYLIPAGFYSQLWDWDAFFMANHFISRNQPEYMKYLIWTE